MSVATSPAAAPSAPSATSASAPAAPTTTATPSTSPSTPAAGHAQTAAATTTATPQQPGEKRYTRVIDGKRVELTRDEAAKAILEEWGEDEVLDVHSLRRGAYSRMEQAAAARREAEELKKKLAGSDRAFSEWLALQPDQEKALQQLEAEMSRRYQESLQSPEQRALREAQEKLRGYEEREKTAAEKAKAQQREKAVAQYREHFATGVREAAKAVLGISGDVPPIVVQAMALHAERSLKARQPVDFQAIARVVQRELREHTTGYLGGVGDEELDTLLGPRFEKIAALRAARAQQQAPQAGAAVTAPRRGGPPTPVTPPRDDAGRFAKPAEASPPVSLEEAFRRLRR